MKHIFRKPMLPVVVLALMAFGTGFLAFFRADIAAGWEQVDRLYADTVITVELIPEAGWADLQMKTHKDARIAKKPEVAETLTVQDCYYVLRDGTPLPLPEETDEPGDDYAYSYIGNQYLTMETDILRGTNNLPWLAEYWNLTITWCDGCSIEDFKVVDGQAVCLVRQEMLETEGIELGGTICVSPAPWNNQVSPNAPEIPLTVIGAYEESAGQTGERDLLVPEECLLHAPKLLYNSDMMYRCYYRAYALRLNPEYNREYDRIEDELEEILFDLSDFSFVSNARAIENAARPLMQKLQMQETLVMPLTTLLCAAVAVLVLLLARSFDMEVFLRLMWGEGRAVVFCKMLGTLGLWLLAGVAVSTLAGTLTGGQAWVGWSASYAAMTAAVSMAAAAVTLGRACGRNLVAFYQSNKEE